MSRKTRLAPALLHGLLISVPAGEVDVQHHPDICSTLVIIARHPLFAHRPTTELLHCAFLDPSNVSAVFHLEHGPGTVLCVDADGRLHFHFEQVHRVTTCSPGHSVVGLKFQTLFLTSNIGPRHL